MPANVLYGQAGGVTAVINASAHGVIQGVRHHRDHFGRIYAAREGIIGALREDLVDLEREDAASLDALRHTPGGAFGACRYDLGPLESHKHQYERLMEVFAAHDIGYFFYNGGGGSMVTAEKVHVAAQQMGYPLTVMGIPKTIDNDLAGTDTSPGFGSAAKYVATSVREAALDVASMAESSTKVFIMEVMGRHAGWLAAAGGLAQGRPDDAPQIVLFAERAFHRRAFMDRVREIVERVGYCVVVASEGLRDADGQFLSVAESSHVEDWIQLGGVAPNLAEMVRRDLDLKVHWALPDYLQRAAAHIGSATDVEQAAAVGERAVELAVAGENGRMPVIRRESDEPYEWSVDSVDLARIADVETTVPEAFIREDGYHITEAARRYLAPLIRGEARPPFINGLPDYARLGMFPVERRLPPYELDEQVAPQKGGKPA
ncbi:6-phosphofructokinase 1 [Thiohalospira halophila DSM 15071]|uniref:Pyrophosphate--fructose 6-phosphate 1-phosphotransferase n=1 Tax=Thiohalospira halophila DSM 15071 TaxID=1123397 RepID=A0A1I1RPD0_9GAMM|nr:6-phosphofructokinase [Thiohalospira halophila]SFD32380.1 6-phosphofructokinase 1 [Thiohalospira halophila DSM 15071]